MAELDTKTLSLSLPTASETAMSEVADARIGEERWSRIQMTEPGEVNGVRFLTGTIIDAQTPDADKLIRSGKAIRVDEDGKITDHDGDDFTDRDTDAKDSNETLEAVDNLVSISPGSDDDANDDAPHGMSDADAETEADEPNAVSGDHAETEAEQPQEISEDDAEIADDQSQKADTEETPKAPNSTITDA